MPSTDRLRAVIAIQQEVVAAGLDPDDVAQLVAERAHALVSGSGATVEAAGDDGTKTLGRSGAAAGEELSVPLVHNSKECGTLRVFAEDGFEEADAEALTELSGLIAAQLCHALEYARCWRDGREDPVTGLLNRRAYDETLDREAARARRHGRELALCLFDLDDFKRVNDTEGHLAGDDVLRAFAEVLRRVRGSDYAFRIGGDEFALVLPETDRGGADTVANRLLASTEARASVGTATVSDGGEPRTLHAAADAELYGAKRRRG